MLTIQKEKHWMIFTKVMNSLFIQVIYVHIFALPASTEASAKDGDAAEVLTQYCKINFLMSLISYFITGSRTVVELRSKNSPSGLYTTLLNIWINTDSKIVQFQMIKTN